MSANLEDELMFAEAEPLPTRAVRPWKVLVVDDDPQVLAVTQLVLRGMEYADRPIQLIEALSARQAREILAREQDVALAMLDVVMETEDAGLQLVRFIRDEMQNRLMRIVLRTGQPGLAPERKVILNYDINDYKAKAELTADRLFTTLITALRGYGDIVAIETSRRGLEKLIQGAPSLFELRSLEQFFSGVLMQITALPENVESCLLATRGSFRDGESPSALRFWTGSGRFADLPSGPLHDIDDPDVMSAVSWAFENRSSEFFNDRCAVFFDSRGDLASVVYLETLGEVAPVDRKLIQLFCNKASIAFDNILLFEQVNLAQESTVLALARLAEFKDNDTGAHVRRVEAMTVKIARALFDRHAFPGELDEVLLSKIGLASVLHDVGKVSIPDAVLGKAGKLDGEEWAVMQRHAITGAIILDEAARLVRGRSFLSVGAEIAASHHEHYDGSGYPSGLEGSGIPLAARIVAVADVYDALTSRRSYKEPWPQDKAIAYIAERAGTQFDPLVVEVFLELVGQAVPAPLVGAPISG